MSVFLTFVAGAAVGTVVAPRLRHRLQAPDDTPEMTVLNDAPTFEVTTPVEAAPIEAAPDDAKSAEDKLENIWGIGPIYAKRLHNAGIHTFGELAATTPERVLEIVSPTVNSPRPDVEPWLKQAAELANNPAS